MVWNRFLHKIGRPVEYFSIIFLITILATINISFSTLSEKELKSKYDFFKPVIKKLKAKNVDSSFIFYMLSDPATVFDEKFVKINVTGFLKKPDYSRHYNDESVRKSVSFIKQNYSVLNNCQEQSGIPKEVITSIIYIETKFGNFLGKYNIPSVFLSTAMANCDEYIIMNKNQLYSHYNGDSTQIQELEKKIVDRANKKSDWAINELVNLEKIYKIGEIDILHLRGSWAGAFGLSQFLPSSYLQWAVDGNGDGIIDLFNTEDAIYSIANYLKVNGWGTTDVNQKKALFHYNNSNDYVHAVLTLAGKIRMSKKLSIPLSKQLESEN